MEFKIVADLEATGARKNFLCYTKKLAYRHIIDELLPIVFQ